ncbi:MAG: ester cyclase [Thermoanaerobaculia bacterium]|nr:ester cyclase [Thermoanaerobaculia bacterium]
MTTRADGKELLIRFIDEVWNAGNVAAADRYVAPNYTIHHDPGDPWDKKVLDLSGYKERVRVSRAPFPDQRFSIRDILAEDDRVVMTWHWAGTHLGDLPGFPATGNQIRMSGATVYYIEGGRFTGHWQVTDRLGVYAQLRQGLTQSPS